MAGGQSALWARVTDEYPAIPSPEALTLALSRAEHERASLAQSVHQLQVQTQAWHDDTRAQRADLLRLQGEVTSISRRLQRAVLATEERQDRQRDALACLHDSSADLVDAVRSHSQRTLHELEQLRDELRESSDRSAWRARLAFVGCFAACVISLAAWIGSGQAGPRGSDGGQAATSAAPVGTSVYAGFRRTQ